MVSHQLSPDYMTYLQSEEISILQSIPKKCNIANTLSKPNLDMQKIFNQTVFSGTVLGVITSNARRVSFISLLPLSDEEQSLQVG